MAQSSIRIIPPLRFIYFLIEALAYRLVFIIPLFLLSMLFSFWFMVNLSRFSNSEPKLRDYCKSIVWN